MSLVVKSVLCILICLGLGIGSGFVGGSPDSSWYQSLDKPWFQPPAWLFGPAWTLLYTLIGVSIARIWHNNSKPNLKKGAIIIFVMQFVLNLMWTPVFFGVKNPSLAMFIIIVLWFAILITIKRFKTIDRLSAYLLIPYLLWVSFATILNGSIVYLN